jgi:hypothetical protein
MILRSRYAIPIQSQTIPETETPQLAIHHLYYFRLAHGDRDGSFSGLALLTGKRLPFRAPIF